MRRSVVMMWADRRRRKAQEFHEMRMARACWLANMLACVAFTGPPS